MLTFVLIRAGEGETKEIWVAHRTLAALARVVADTLTAQIADFPLPWTDGNQGFMVQERDALLAMLATTLYPCTPGRYLLPPVDPVWEQCILLITDHDTGSVDSPSS